MLDVLKISFWFILLIGAGFCQPLAAQSFLADTNNESLTSIQRRIEKLLAENHLNLQKLPPSTDPVQYASGLAGVYAARDLESIDVSKTADLIREKTLWTQLEQAGRKPLENYVKKEVKSYLKDQVGGQLAGQYGGIAGDLAGDMLFGSEEKKAEDAARTQLLNAERMLKQQINLKNQLQYQFNSILEDHPVSIVATQPETYFFIVNKEAENQISFSLFSLRANSYNQLPYKVEVMKAYQKRTQRTENFMYGPYESLSQARDEIKKIADIAFLGFQLIAPDVGFVYQKDGQTIQNNTTDFWGNSNDAAKKPAATSETTDFWGVKKKNDN